MHVYKYIYRFWPVNNELNNKKGEKVRIPQLSAVGNEHRPAQSFHNVSNVCSGIVSLVLAFAILLSVAFCLPNEAIAATKFNAAQQKLISRWNSYEKAIKTLSYDVCYEMLSVHSKGVITRDQWKAFIFQSAGKAEYKVFDVVIEPEGRRARVDVSGTSKFDGKSAMHSQTWIYEGNKWFRAFAEDRKPQQLNSNSGDNRNIHQEGISVTPNNVTYSSPGGGVTIEILKIITGEQVVSNHKLHEHQLSSMREQGKEPIYFEVKVTNNKFNGELSLSQFSFKLESDKAETFSTEMTRDYINGRIHQGRSATGGVAYAIYTNSKPKWLRYKTGLQNLLGEEVELVSPDLQQIMSNIK